MSDEVSKQSSDGGTPDVTTHRTHPPGLVKHTVCSVAVDGKREIHPKNRPHASRFLVLTSGGL